MTHLMAELCRHEVGICIQYNSHCAICNIYFDSVVQCLFQYVMHYVFLLLSYGESLQNSIFKNKSHVHDYRNVKNEKK